MFRNTLLALLLAAASVAAASAQKLPTASRNLNIQAGGEFVYGSSDYQDTTEPTSSKRIDGYGFYGDIDFRPHIGAELEYHQANGDDLVYERTYLAGARYVWHRNRLHPYVKILGGRGVFNSPPYFPGGKSAFNFAYNMFTPGGGVDYNLKSYLNLRADFEYQYWLSNPGLIHGLNPYIGSIGVAYHFK